MTENRCSFCARLMVPGSLRYVLMWKMFADYDGIIDLEDERSLENTMRAVKIANGADLEDQVYLERRHILCPSCREEILDSLAAFEHSRSEPEEPAGGNGEGERNLH
ncbi:MAG: hypothetical protein P1S46_06325 [bacterium]|nr:hypothetical protein [bacterium]MDT8396566.1 hypothetical protein [bacterium]